MGRGRAKAKQVKVARQLKYGGGGTDLDRLRAELLGVGADQRGSGERRPGDRDGHDDRYSFADEDQDDDEDDEELDEDDEDDEELDEDD